MKTKFLASIIIGVIILGSFSFVYGIMYDCLNPPMWMKMPKSDFRYCFGLLLNGHLPDYPNYATYEEYRAARDANINFISEPTEDEKIVNQFKNLPEVKAFFTKYEDANVSVRSDHISYFAGSHDDILVRMNLFFDQNFELDHIDFHCYYKRTHLFEESQEDIVYFLENRDCKKRESEGDFMGKSLDYWKGLNFDQLREFNSRSGGDDFYYALGNLLAKEFFQNELDNQNIEITNNDIVVHSGWALLPDPPIIGYNTVVNATDGSTYVMHTSVQGNKIGEYFEMERLIFEPHILQAIAEEKPAKFVNKFGETPTIYIVTKDGDDFLEPHDAIIDFEQTNSVRFVNNSPNSVRIQEVGENKIEDIPSNTWSTKQIRSGEEITLQLNSTGLYEFNVKKITNSIPGFFEHHASGEIVAFTENMTGYTFEEGLLMGRVFIQDAPRAEIPWQGIGAGNPRGLEIGIVNSVKEAIPNADEYYLAKAKSLIPFDVIVIIE